mmetsp:Transcript_5609/g.7846  ORF Transcript_5609/g.7846 Transcript_5609/m.7846 type:complete len:275 (-) Transcript_5609:54-878(-)
MADSKKDDGLYPAHFKKKQIANHLKPQKFNSTSTLYIDSTISKPKHSELMRCISEYFLKCMKDGTNVSDAWRDKYQIFDESQHPLTSTHVDTTNLPDIEKVEKHIKSVFKIGQLAHESLIMSVAYLDRIRENTDFDLQPFNWKRMILSLLILASKVWEDQAVWNVDFLDLFPLTTPHDLGQLEKKVLGLLSFDVSLKASEYAKIYFNLKAESVSTVEHFLELKPLDKDGETALELRTKNYTAKYNAPPDTKLFRSTGSVDDLSSNIRSPKVILN